MNKREKIDEEKFKLEQLREWNNNADTKISIMVAFVSVLFIEVISNSNINIIKEINDIIFITGILNVGFFRVCSLMLVIILYILIFLSIYKFIKALLAKIDISVFNQKGIYKESSYFFGTISKMNLYEYKNKIYKSNENIQLNDLISQVYINSKICKDKFKFYNTGLKLFIASIILMTVCIVFNLL